MVLASIVVFVVALQIFMPYPLTTSMAMGLSIERALGWGVALGFISG